MIKNFDLKNKKKAELVNSAKQNLSKVVSGFFIPEKIKQEILNLDFIKSNPSCYLYYPSLFQNFFQLDLETINQLNVSSFLYYKSIIFIDELFDSKENTNEFETYLIANTCQEESLKILSAYFKNDSEFWKTWNIRKSEYVKAYKLDKSVSSLSDDDFEKLADYKSAFGKIGVDVLYFLSENKDVTTYKKLLESHKYYYAAFQILDDLADYKEDVNNGQYNISVQYLKEKLKKDKEDINNYSIDEQVKLVYLKKVAEELYKKADTYIKKAIQITEELSTKDNQWLFEIELLQDKISHNYQQIKSYVEAFTSKQ